MLQMQCKEHEVESGYSQQLRKLRRVYRNQTLAT